MGVHVEVQNPGRLWVPMELFHGVLLPNMESTRAQPMVVVERQVVWRGWLANGDRLVVRWH